MLAATINLTLYVRSLAGPHQLIGDHRRQHPALARGAWSNLQAADALGAAGSLVEATASSAGATQQLTVEVNTLWAPFATGCTLVNASGVTATWQCVQPATRGPASGLDALECDCNQRSMSYPPAEMATKVAPAPAPAPPPPN